MSGASHCQLQRRSLAIAACTRSIVSCYRPVNAAARNTGIASAFSSRQEIPLPFREQFRFWGIAPSLAFVGEPPTNGVVERFCRTLREQVLDGRIYRTVEELRQTVGEFVRRSNEQWLVEKLGFQSPKQAREAYVTRPAA